MYVLDRAEKGTLTEADMRRGRLADAMAQLDVEEDINKVLTFFSYEHFYVMYCKARPPRCLLRCWSCFWCAVRRHVLRSAAFFSCHFRLLVVRLLHLRARLRRVLQGTPAANSSLRLPPVHCSMHCSMRTQLLHLRHYRGPRSCPHAPPRCFCNSGSWTSVSEPHQCVCSSGSWTRITTS